MLWFSIYGLNKFLIDLESRKIRLIESNAKCRYLKKLVSNTTQQLPPPPSHTLSVCILYTVHVLGLEKVRGAIVHKAASKNTNMTVSAVYKLY
jgi:hypothetical protein